MRNARQNTRNNSPIVYSRQAAASLANKDHTMKSASDIRQFSHPVARVLAPSGAYISFILAFVAPSTVKHSSAMSGVKVILRLINHVLLRVGCLLKTGFEILRGTGQLRCQQHFHIP